MASSHARVIFDFRGEATQSLPVDQGYEFGHAAVGRLACNPERE